MPVDRATLGDSTALYDAFSDWLQGVYAHAPRDAAWVKPILDSFWLGEVRTYQDLVGMTEDALSKLPEAPERACAAYAWRAVKMATASSLAAEPSDAAGGSSEGDVGKKEVHIKNGSCPRVAICLSGKAGLLRLDEPVTSLPGMKKLIDELGPADVFASVADDTDKEAVTRLLAPTRCKVRPTMNDGDLMSALGGHPEFHVKKDSLSDLKDEEAKCNQAWVNGIIFWAINHAHTLASEEEVARQARYDVIVRVRYDLIFQENTVLQVKQLMTELLHNSCGEGARPILNVPMINNFGGVNDQFGFGNRQAMQAYADTFKKYRNLARHADVDSREATANGETLEPGFFVDLQTEKCLQRSLEVGRVEVRRHITLLPRILRGDGTTDDICA